MLLGDSIMALSLRQVDALIDILENKLSDMVIWDCEDRKEIVILNSCLEELTTMRLGSGNVVPLSGRRRVNATVA
jgi:hypothetical protein